MSFIYEYLESWPSGLYPSGNKLSRLLKAIIQFIPDIKFIINAQNNIIFCNFSVFFILHMRIFQDDITMMLSVSSSLIG